MKTSEIDLVVTRHPGLVEILREQGLVGPDCVVTAHAGPDDVRGRHVAGVLPLRLAAMCISFTEVSLDLSPALRGVELTAAQVRKHMRGTVRYCVSVVK